MGSQPWYRSLNRSQWNTLIASNLGWLFDGYETYALVISVGVALRQLLDPSQYPADPVLCRHGDRDHAARAGASAG